MSLQVTLYHYCNHYNHLYGHLPTFSLYFPVNNIGNRLFIILSGFVTLMTLEGKKKLSDFWIARVIRLFPSYWVGIILTATIVAIFSLPGRETTLGETLFNFTMLQRFFLIKDVDGVYWALAAILLFYACLSIIYSLQKMRYLEFIILGWLIVVVIISNGNFPLKEKLEKLFLVEYANLFVAGIAFYKLKAQSSQHNWYLHTLIGLCLVVRGLTGGNISEVFVDFLFFALFYLLIYGKLVFLNYRILIFIGSISYPLYLIHQNIGYVIIRNLYEMGLTNQFLIVLIPLITCILTATIITYYVEKPIMRFLKSKLAPRFVKL